MNKPSTEMLREWADRAENERFFPAVLACEDLGMPYGGIRPDAELFRRLAYEIEREKREIAEAQGRGAHHVIKAYAEAHGKPMREGENITEWLWRYYIPRPRFEDGEPVKWGDELENGKAYCIKVMDDGSWAIDDENTHPLCDGFINHLVKRPATKVLDADGMKIRVGNVVYDTRNGRALKVLQICQDLANAIKAVEEGNEPIYISTKFVTLEKPVFDAEHKRIKAKDTVWEKKTGAKLTVVKPYPYNRVYCLDEEGIEHEFLPKGLTHKEPDTLEKLRDDLARKYGNGSSWVKRVDALMERGA